MQRLSERTHLLVVLAAAALARVATLAAYPLTDDTEARYAEIARKIVETGHWIMPQFDYGVPFWGKPPLSFWLTAGSFEAFGISEFTARLPSFLASVAVCGLLYVLAVGRGGERYALRGCVVLASSALFFVCAGSVMTEPAMLLGTTLGMVAFWRAVQTGSRRWGYLFFVGIAIGLLSKGPVAMVLTLAPIGAWALLTGRIRQAVAVLPWLGGSLLAAAIVVPWYWAAEAQSPGFLHYFLVGEHWQRFTVSGWKGDLYGAGHATTRGVIWLYLLASALPWSAWAISRAMRQRAAWSREALQADDGWLVYLLCWMAAPALLFTLARNILPTYCLPGMVAMALLVAEMWEARCRQRAAPGLLLVGLLVPVLALVAVFGIWPRVGFASQAEIIAGYRQLDPRQESPLVYYAQRPASAEFYWRGRIDDIVDPERLARVLDMPGGHFVATERSSYDRLPADVRQRMRIVRTSRTRKYILLQSGP